MVVERSVWQPAERIRGHRLRTAGYEILTTVQDETLRECVPAFLEACRREYQACLPVSSPATGPGRIYLFDTRQEWAAFTRRFVPAQAELYLHLQAGGYMDAHTATIVVYDLGRDRTLALLAHEGWHQFLALHRLDNIPAWLNEGMATQFESFDLRGGRPVFAPRANLFRKNSLRESLSEPSAWISLPALLRMHAGHAVARTGQPARGYYAQIWALVLFLRAGGEPADRVGLQRLLEDLAADRFAITVAGWQAAHPQAASLPFGEAAFRAYITDDLPAFESRYRAFARTLVR